MAQGFVRLLGQLAPVVVQEQARAAAPTRPSETRISRIGSAAAAMPGQMPSAASSRCEPRAMAEDRPSKAASVRAAGSAASTTVTGIPASARPMARVRPTMPPPEIKTSVVPSPFSPPPTGFRPMGAESPGLAVLSSLPFDGRKLPIF
jgi:hypothetical protein